MKRKKLTGLLIVEVCLLVILLGVALWLTLGRQTIQVPEAETTAAAESTTAPATTEAPTTVPTTEAPTTEAPTEAPTEPPTEETTEPEGG